MIPHLPCILLRLQLVVAGGVHMPAFVQARCVVSSCWQRALALAFCAQALPPGTKAYCSNRIRPGTIHMRLTNRRVAIQAPEEGLRLHILANLLQQVALCRHAYLQGL
jgi:hypothetical protein